MQKQKKYRAKIASMAPILFLALAYAQTVFGQWNPGNYDSTRLPKAQLATIISNIAFWLLAIFGFVAVIGFVISGLMYFLSAGDEDRQEYAKRAMIYSITGVIVGLVGLVVIYAVNFFLGGSSGIGIPSGAINNTVDSPATEATAPALPSSPENGTNWAPTSDRYTDPNANRPEELPF